MALPAQGVNELTAFLTNLFGNVLLFLPFPFLIIIFSFRKTLADVLLAAFLLSICVETAQYLFRIGVADVDDVLLNVFGARIGFAVYAACNKNLLLAKSGRDTAPAAL